MSDHEEQGKTTLVEVDEGGSLIETKISSTDINLDGNALVQKTTSADQLSTTEEPGKNPFTSSGKLSRKADYILSHSTITRSELRISDPDVPSRGKDNADAKERLLNGGVANDSTVEEQPIVAIKVGNEEKQPGLLNGFTSTPVESEVPVVLIQMPEKDRAEQVKLEGGRCSCCKKCCRRCRQCCVVQ